jgi:alkanesulfonate monooxygenase SsuD/methylene tetrahydromethanopterin reductase-like flavin-dependent oxidoreductase (luciferase family)
VKVFVFDLLPYAEHLDHLKVEDELPWPLPKRYFKPEVAIRTYEEHLDAWEEMERLGYDGVGFNEHHTSPYGLMNSPNLMAAALSQRTKRLRMLIYANLLPLHNPLRLAEEIAMLDCLSNGRIIAGIARGIPREYRVFNIPYSESRERFEEAWEILRGLWTEEVFSYEGKYWTFKDVALWPRPVQQPHPPVWVPVTTSKETIEFAARHNLPITPGLGGRGSRGLQQDIIRYYAAQLAAHGHRITPEHLVISVDVYVADSKEQAFREAGPYALYFYRTLFSHGNVTDTRVQRELGYVSERAHDYIRPENRAAALMEREWYRGMTPERLRQHIEHLPWGSPEEVRERILEEAEALGANILLVHMNRGAMPHEMFVNQLRRFAREVLPALQAHEVRRVPWEEEESASRRR